MVARVAGCLVEGTDQFALVFLSEDLSDLVAVLYVAPPSSDAPTLAAR